MHRIWTPLFALTLSFLTTSPALAQQPAPAQPSMLNKEQISKIAEVIAKSEYGQALGVAFDTSKPEFRNGVWSFKPIDRTLNHENNPDAVRYFFEIRDFDTWYRVGVWPDQTRPKWAGEFQMSKEMLPKIKKILHPSLYGP